MKDLEKTTPEEHLPVLNQTLDIMKSITQFVNEQIEKNTAELSGTNSG